MNTEEKNNLILKTMARIQINSLICEIESLTPEQLKNKIVLEAYKDSLTNALSFFEFDVIHDPTETKEKLLHDLRNKLQLKILSLELEEMRSENPPVMIIKHIDETKN